MILMVVAVAKDTPSGTLGIWPVGDYRPGPPGSLVLWERGLSAAASESEGSWLATEIRQHLFLVLYTRSAPDTRGDQ